MTDPKDYIEMSIRASEFFSSDGKFDAQEMGQLIAIAERDGVIDQDEIRVLRNIISRINPDEVDGAMKAKLAEILEKVNPKK
jgi:tellurite resistance protein